MGAGDQPAGDELAGDGFALVQSRPRNVSPPAAVLYDGATRDFPLDASGLYVEEHPTDQKVGLALLVARGTLAGSPTVGGALRKKRLLNPATILTEITYVVKGDLAALIKAKEIALVRVDAEIPAETQESRLLVRVVYENLLLNAALAKASRIRTKGVLLNG